MSRAVVSGVTGHLGRRLAAQLTAAKIEVHGLTRSPPEGVQPELRSVRLHQVDGRTETLAAIFTEIRPDLVCHLAAATRREHHLSDVVPFIEANVLFGTQLLEAMRLCNCNRLILAGSYLQHFDAEAYRPFNLYAATKQALEDIVAFYVDIFRFSVIRLTLSDIYSEHDTRPKLMTQIATACITRTPMVLEAEDAWIDPIHVEDAAAACLRAATLLDQTLTLVGSLTRYSVTSSRNVNATQLIGIFEALTHQSITVIRPVGQKTARSINPRHGPILPGWAPKISLEQGIERIIAHRTRNMPRAATTHLP